MSYKLYVLFHFIVKSGLKAVISTKLTRHRHDCVLTYDCCMVVVVWLYKSLQDFLVKIFRHILFGSFTKLFQSQLY